MRTSHIRVSRSYTKGIFTFIGIAVVLVGISLYITLSKATITILPQIREIETEFIVDVSDQPFSASSYFVNGSIEEKIIEKTRIYNSSGRKTIAATEVSGTDVIGSVELFNDKNTQMDLVQRTRLQAPDGELFRLKNSVSIPANSSIQADIYADDPENFDGLDIVDFIIPGLSADSQKEVYAKNKKRISIEDKDIQFVTKDDIDQAVKTLSNEMIQESLHDIKLKYGDSGPVSMALSGEILESISDKAVDAEGNDFEVTVKMKVVSVFMDKSEIFNAIEQELEQYISDDEKFIGVDTQKISYHIEKYDTDAKTAHIVINSVGKIAIEDNHPILDKEKVIGSTKSQAEIYYKSFDQIKDVSIDLQPFWVTRIPSMKDKVEIIVR